ncbi:MULTISPECIES: glycosyltransferase family 39 protein [unclassified Coleofasciculus]|uniref:glycosyltransferase family 39 protein n=1 Tax=unclassified Coleofasciculus TaxID=2692782 RepID=UPI0018815762|nr:MULTISPECIES: glycosyltransferase family 39 protein [unclassified Coleofasciculus]MBE9125741.1 glycosyltransferase family 39 protein [Coleofasciculus sp. LEGE 07081]MBE9147229.1 glycosyltransferase family 39 protein [Coleofasciculus sp. LEGE 07092]
MQTTVNQTRNFSWTGLRFFVLILLILGIVLRFGNIDNRAYSGDETSTSLQIAGYTKTELRELVFNGRVLSVEELLKYQDTNPNKSLLDTVTAMAAENPHHPPLYYVIARLWVQWLGPSPAVTRGVAAFISLLIFPSIYWLCWELFESSLVGWIAIALVTVSPFHVWTAQTAREYSLWAVIILVSGAVLLRTLRLNTKRSWLTYAGNLTVGVYSHLFFWLVAIGYGIYIFILEGCKRTKTFNAYLRASLIGFLVFVPWIVLVNTDWTKVYTTTTWTKEKLPLVLGDDSLLKRWAGNLCSIFAFFDFDYQKPFLLWLTACLLAGMVGYAIYFLYRHTPQRVWVFIFTLMGVTALTLVLPDLVLGGVRSASSRYLTPCYLGIQLAVAYLLAMKMMPLSVKVWQQKLWQLLFIVLISSGTLSCVITPPHHRWNGTSVASEGVEVSQVSRIVNQAKSPLFILDIRPTEILPFSYQLDPKVRLQLVERPNVPNVAEGFSDIFLYSPSRELRKGLEQEQNYKLKVVDESLQVWQLEK